MRIPLEIYDLITYYVSTSELDPSDFRDKTRHWLNLQSMNKEDLAALRLVNRVFCRSASTWLFRHINAKSSASLPTSPLERLLELSRSPCALHVYHIEFGFSSGSSPLAHVVDSLYVQGISRCLSSLLERFINLKALDFHEPPSSLSQDQRKLYLDTVSSTLLHVPFPTLTELELRFPLTLDFERFFATTFSARKIHFEETMRRLQYLGLYICAYTDQQDRRYWRKPILPEHLNFPNDSYAFQLSRMIQMAPSTKSLAIHSVDILDIDLFKFPYSICLQSLSLEGVSISSDVLLSVFNRSAERMGYIRLWQVRLKSGTWKEMLLQMQKLECLLDLDICHCGYSFTGSSSHLADRLVPGLGYHPSIETLNGLDIPALGSLQRQVNLNRIAVGHQPFHDTYFKHIHERPIEV